MEVLKLFLDALGVLPNIATVADRKRLQKAVYLGQLSGVDLGYRFNWYRMGPYSPSLAREYYKLAEAVTAGTFQQKKRLRLEAIGKLEKVRPLFATPQDVGLPQEDWLEALASYHFLRTVSKLSHEKTVATLAETKSHVLPYVERVREVLADRGLLNAA